MVVAVSRFAELVILAGAITAGATAISMGIALVVGGLARQAGKDVDPWDLSTTRAAPLGACFGLAITVIELVPGK